MSQPQVATPGAPATTPPSAPATTAARPTVDPNAIAAFRQAQSANDRVTALSQQIGQLTKLVQGVVHTQDAQSDEQFYSQLGTELADGTINQATYTRKIAERTAQRAAAALQPATPATPPTPQPQQPNPAQGAQQAREIGARAILSGLGLSGQEQGLDFSSPQSLVLSGQRVLAARTGAAPQQTSTQGRDVNAEMAELARQQGYVIPHRDGGTPASAAQPVTEQDLHRITTNKSLIHAPRKMIASLQAARDSLAARVGTTSEGSAEGLMGAPGSFRA